MTNSVNNNNYPIFRMNSTGYFVELPSDAGVIVDMYERAGKLWIETREGKKYIIPHYSQGKPIRADLRVVE